MGFFAASSHLISRYTREPCKAGCEQPLTWGGSRKDEGTFSASSSRVLAEVPASSHSCNLCEAGAARRTARTCIYLFIYYCPPPPSLLGFMQRHQRIPGAEAVPIMVSVFIRSLACVEGLLIRVVAMRSPRSLPWSTSPTHDASRLTTLTAEQLMLQMLMQRGPLLRQRVTCYSSDDALAVDNMTFQSVFSLFTDKYSFWPAGTGDKASIWTWSKNRWCQREHVLVPQVSWSAQ